jgi:hypothetical protein
MQFDKFEPLRRALGRSVSLQRVREGWGVRCDEG